MSDLPNRLVFTLRAGDAVSADFVCLRCARPTPMNPSICLTPLCSPTSVLCQACGREQAPILAALFDLAQVAERIGRIRQHTSSGDVPLGCLLELAQAADRYVQQVEQTANVA